MGLTDLGPPVLDRRIWKQSVKYALAAFLKGARPESCGAVANVASVHAVETEPLVAPYAAAKAALFSLTRLSALEGRPAVLPGAVAPPMLRDNPHVKSGASFVCRPDLNVDGGRLARL